MIATRPYTASRRADALYDILTAMDFVSEKGVEVRLEIHPDLSGIIHVGEQSRNFGNADIALMYLRQFAQLGYMR